MSMRFKDFLSIFKKEEARTPFHIPIQKSGVISFLKKNPIARENIRDGLYLYRGQPKIESVAALADSSKFRRKVKSGWNYINLFVSSSPSWTKFPNRENAIICSSNNMGDAYGHSHIVIPDDKARIGVCPSSDFWVSFQTLKRTMLPTVSDLNALFDWYERTSGIKFADEPHALRNQLMNISPKAIIDLAKEKITREHDFYDRITSVADDANFRGYENMAEFLDDLLDPQKNEFKVISPRDIISLNSVETWVSGKVMMLKIEDRATLETWAKEEFKD
jgi:hypothetical protein